VKKTVEVSDELLQWWMESVANVTRFVADVFPNSRLLWRTYAMPRYNATTGNAMHHALATKQMLVQVW
jgi:hypothetical protein